MKTRIITASIIIALFFSCKKEDTATGDEPIPPADEFVHNLNKTSLLSLINQSRLQGCTCGTTVMPSVAAITWNDQLGNAAYLHSADMNSNNYFSHTGLDGSTPGTRIAAQGYNWKSYGENIANGFTSEQSVMQGWLNSEGHCKNIMDSKFKEIGAGRSGNYWTEVFGSK